MRWRAISFGICILSGAWLGVASASNCAPAPSSSTAKRSPTPKETVVSSSQARQIAIEAFRRETANKIRSYSVKMTTDSDEYWEFFIQGTGKYARPGYHWIVKVKKVGGVPEVISGE
jgi:hypothetical protein